MLNNYLISQEYADEQVYSIRKLFLVHNITTSRLRKTDSIGNDESL